MSVTRLLRTGLRMAEIVSGSNSLSIIGTTEGIAVGDRVRGPGIPAGATVTVVAATTVTISANATLTANQQVNFEGQMANPGSTGNNTHAGINADQNFDAETLDLEFEITAVGATPTVSWLYQGSMDGPDVADSASDWFALEVLPSDAAAELATVQTKTAVGVYASSLELARRPIRKIRLVTSANTNCTYEADAYGVDTSAV